MQRSDLLNNFKLWLEDNGALFPDIILRNSLNETGDGINSDIGVFLNKNNIYEDSNLLEIPNTIVLGDETNIHSKQLQNIIHFINNKPDNWFIPILIPSLCLLYAKHNQEENRFWNPYIQILPNSESLSCSLYYTSEELLLLNECKRARKIYDLTNQVVNTIEEDMIRLQELFPDDILDIFTNINEIKWVISIIFSRAWKYDNGNWCLLPMFDMFNHSFSVCDEQDLTMSSDNSFIIKSKTTYNENDEIFIRYGCDDNAKLLALYGFITLKDNNDYNNINIEIDLTFPLNEYSIFLLTNLGYSEYIINTNNFKYTWNIMSNHIFPDELIHILRLTIITNDEYNNCILENDKGLGYSLRSEYILYKYLLECVIYYSNQYSYSLQDDIEYLKYSNLSFNTRNIISLTLAEKQLINIISIKLEDYITHLDTLMK